MRLRLDDAPAHEVDGLQVPSGARGFQSGPLELFGDVRRRFAIAVSAGLPSFEAVVGKRLDVRPPAGLVGANRGWALSADGDSQDNRERGHAQKHVFHTADHNVLPAFEAAEIGRLRRSETGRRYM
jgi:hypothetical protein